MRVNCWLLRDEATGEGVVIDPGGENAADKILARIETKGIRVRGILLTHAHFDHMLSLERLREALNVPVSVHSHDADALLDPNLSYMAQFAGITQPCKPAENLLSDGDVFPFGESSLTVLHTPGHTVGSVCFMADGILISGDTLFAGSIGRCDLYGGDDMAMAQSLKRLRELPGDYKVYPGHGSVTSLSRERENNIYMK